MVCWLVGVGGGGGGGKEGREGNRGGGEYRERGEGAGRG